MNLKPIETAPKDGTWILLIGGYDVDAGDYFHMPAVVAFWEPMSKYSDGAWRYCFWEGDWRSEYCNPTHWMPLPEPPTSST